MKNKLLVLSVIVNIGLIIFCCIKHTHSQPNLSAKKDTLSVWAYEITLRRNFETVYFNKNDNIYKDLWGRAFEDEPEQAFLISCSYFYVTKDKRVLKDIEVSAEQLEQAYQRELKINTVQTTP